MLSKTTPILISNSGSQVPFSVNIWNINRQINTLILMQILLLIINEGRDFTKGNLKSNYFTKYSDKRANLPSRLLPSQWNNSRLAEFITISPSRESSVIGQIYCLLRATRKFKMRESWPFGVSTTNDGVDYLINF